MSWGDYIVYVDESGDHSLTSINPQYPVFVLACCIFKKDIYTNVIAPQFQQFKMSQWGHDMVILHEREIREKQNSFGFLFAREKHEIFMRKLNTMIEETSLTLIATIVDKKELKNHYELPDNPYEIALKFCIERLWFFLKENNQESKITHLVVEGRGKREDAELKMAFHRICEGDNHHNRVLPIELIFAKKESNSIGLQLADLFARPIGRYQLNPQQINRAYSLIEPKFYRSQKGKIKGYGLKCFP